MSSAMASIKKFDSMNNKKDITSTETSRSRVSTSFKKK